MRFGFLAALGLRPQGKTGTLSEGALGPRQRTFQDAHAGVMTGKASLDQGPHALFANLLPSFFLADVMPSRNIAIGQVVELGDTFDLLAGLVRAWTSCLVPDLEYFDDLDLVLGYRSGGGPASDGSGMGELRQVLGPPGLGLQLRRWSNASCP